MARCCHGTCASWSSLERACDAIADVLRRSAVRPVLALRRHRCRAVRPLSPAHVRRLLRAHRGWRDHVRGVPRVCETRRQVACGRLPGPAALARRRHRRPRRDRSVDCHAPRGMIAQRHAGTHRVRRSLWLVRARTSNSDAANGATRFRCCTANRLRSAPAAIEARPFDRRTRRHDLHARRYGVFVPTNVRRCEPRLSQDDYRWCERLGARRMVLSCALNSPRLIASACRDKAAPLHHQTARDRAQRDPGS